MLGDCHGELIERFPRTFTNEVASLDHSHTGSGVGRALPVVEDPVNARLTLFNGSKVGGKDAVFVYVFRTWDRRS